jgi:hypothetical protein
MEACVGATFYTFYQNLILDIYIKSRFYLYKRLPYYKKFSLIGAKVFYKKVKIKPLIQI